jgi:DNA-binding transcriptional regulator YiaG
MPNLSQVIKAEISRISRKEIKAAVGQLRSSTIALKKSAAKFKKRIAILESESRCFISFMNVQESREKPKTVPEPDAKVRITSKGIHKLRTKLGLSQDAFAKLLGLSSQAIYVMEHKQGRLNLRTTTLSNLLSVRGIGKREAHARLLELNQKGKKKGIRRMK